MDDVSVHYNSSKPAQLQALAYAQGTDIHIAPGQEKHLPHEAWHVAQQKQGRVKPTMQMKVGVPVNDDAGLENEADVMGAKALQSGIQLSKPLQPMIADKAKSNSSGIIQRALGDDFIPNHPPRDNPLANSLADEEAEQAKQNPLADEEVGPKYVRKRSQTVFEDHRYGISGMHHYASTILAKSDLWKQLSVDKKISISERLADKANVDPAASTTGAVASGVKEGVPQKVEAGVTGDKAEEVSQADTIGAVMTKAITDHFTTVWKGLQFITSLKSGGMTKESGIAGLESVKSAATSAKLILEHVDKVVPTELAATIPGLGIAISACKIMIKGAGIFNNKEVTDALDSVETSKIFADDIIYETSRQKDFPAFFIAEECGKIPFRKEYYRLSANVRTDLQLIYENTKDRQSLWGKYAKQNGLTEAQQKYDFQKLYLGVMKHDLLSKTREIALKRQVNDAIGITGEIIGIASNIAALIPGGQLASLILNVTKISVSVGNSSGKFISSKIANARNDSEKSSSAKHLKYVQHVKNLYFILEAIPNDANKNDKLENVEKLVKGTGASEDKVYALNGQDEQPKLLIDSMKKGR